MASPIEIKPGPDRFGARRFVVRGRLYGPEPEIVRVSDLVDDIPERWPLNPMFPKPGQRGGSRPRAQEGLPEPGFPAPVDPYPPDRGRQSREPVLDGGGLPGPDDPLARPARVCASDGGFGLSFNPIVAPSTVSVNVSVVIPFPFVIVHVGFLSDGAITNNDGLLIKVASDNDTSGGVATTGQLITGNYSPDIGYLLGTSTQHIYPNYLVVDDNQFIKVIISTSGVVGNRLLQIIVDIKPIG